MIKSWPRRVCGGRWCGEVLVAPIPRLSQSAMEVLGGREVTPELAAGEAAAKVADPMSENEFKVQQVKVATKRALVAAAGLEVPSWS